MKITIEENKLSKELEHPCILINKDNEIILSVKEDDKFKDYFSGIVLRSSDRPIGQFSTSWFVPHFKKFNGKVTLENC